MHVSRDTPPQPSQVPPPYVMNAEPQVFPSLASVHARPASDASHARAVSELRFTHAETESECVYICVERERARAGRPHAHRRAPGVAAPELGVAGI